MAREVELGGEHESKAPRAVCDKIEDVCRVIAEVRRPCDKLSAAPKGVTKLAIAAQGRLCEEATGTARSAERGRLLGAVTTKMPIIAIAKAIRNQSKLRALRVA